MGGELGFGILDNYYQVHVVSVKANDYLSLEAIMLFLFCLTSKLEPALNSVSLRTQ